MVIVKVVDHILDSTNVVKDYKKRPQCRIQEKLIQIIFYILKVKNKFHNTTKKKKNIQVYYLNLNKLGKHEKCHYLSLLLSWDVSLKSINIINEKHYHVDFSTLQYYFNMQFITYLNLLFNLFDILNLKMGWGKLYYNMKKFKKINLELTLFLKRTNLLFDSNKTYFTIYQ
ncbi:hypothetical protein AGLY_005860 [Aphis glycines]|uniref:Uncharacterized protein n=1 Tax=Aphis glycines TaxID=307491 RepID=A0A6G0TS41_APHGL|nr:hypothetical protein AGLY_005860 [Aphis glycines]